MLLYNNEHMTLFIYDTDDKIPYKALSLLIGILRSEFRTTSYSLYTERYIRRQSAVILCI